ncbi:hypothetical protein, partial [Paractinoplanes ferrugineus]
PLADPPLADPPLADPPLADPPLADPPLADPQGDRRARFGTLPPLVQPDTIVETVAIDPPRGLRSASATEEQRQLFLAGG